MSRREPQEIRREIARTREDIARSLLELQSSVSMATDWRVWAKRRPLTFSAAVFGAGFVAGIL